MPRAYKWQKLAFTKQLMTMLDQIEADHINKLEFKLLTDEAHLLFATAEDEKRFLGLFKRVGHISKKQFVSSISLVETEVRHNKRFNIVRLLPTPQEINHLGTKCFCFWMSLMEDLFGPVHMWFEYLCQEKDIRRISIQNFNIHLNRVLKGSSHQTCAHKISLMFQKSKHNQILGKVFTNTIVVNRKLLVKEFKRKNSREAMSVSAVKLKTETKDSESGRKTSSDLKLSPIKRSIWSAKFTSQRYGSNQFIISAKDPLQ